jgi:leucyl-tRNA synthetase
VLYDCGVVSTKEPFHRLVNQGMILGEVEYTAQRNASGAWVSYTDDLPEGYERVKLDFNEVEKKGEKFYVKGSEAVVDARSYKMSKSRGNVINPDDVIQKYGADALRLYEMFMGPLEQVKPWSMHGVEGVYRFLQRVWRVFIDEDQGQLNKDIVEVEPTRDQLKVLHETIRKVTDDIEGMRYNTAISALMIMNNEVMKWPAKPISVMKTFLLLLSPFAPHQAEELWQRLGGAHTLAYEAWPEWNETYLVSDSITIAIQVNGKLRGDLTLPSNLIQDKAHILELAKAEPTVAKYLAEGTLVKEIYVSGKIVNLVIT